MKRRLSSAVAAVAVAIAVFAAAIPASFACGSYADFRRMRDPSIQQAWVFMWLDPDGGRVTRDAKAAAGVVAASETSAQIARPALRASR